MTSNLDPAALEAACKAAGGLSSWEAAAAITAYLNTLSHAGEGEPVWVDPRELAYVRRDGHYKVSVYDRRNPHNVHTSPTSTQPLYAAPRPDYSGGGARHGTKPGSDYHRRTEKLPRVLSDESRQR